MTDTQTDNFRVILATILWGSLRLSLAEPEPDPYAGGEGLVNCYISSCTAASYTAVPIRLQF